MKLTQRLALVLSAMVLTFTLSIESVAHMKAPKKTVASVTTENQIGELNPFDPDIEKQLNAYDAKYILENGEAPYYFEDLEFNFMNGCRRDSCAIWLQIVKSTQTAYLYINGALFDTFKVSSGLPRYETPNFDKHPNGRIYTKYSSTKYPGGDYNGLGNMPYAVFIHGGFAVHGTPKGNWSKLGQKASHGCVRMHPDKGRIFNSLVRQYGIYNTWITIQK